MPHTLSDFIDICERLEAAGIIPIAAGFREQWTLICDNFSDHLPATYGAAPNWSDDLQTGNTRWTYDPGNFSQQLELLYNRHRFVNPDPFGTDWNAATEMLASGRAAMILNGNWTIDSVKQKNPDVNLGTFALPFSEDPTDTKLAIGATGGLIAYANSPNLDMVMKFFAHMTTEEMANQFQIYRQGMSTVKGLTIDFEPALNDIIRYANEGRAFNISVINRDFGQEYQKSFGDNLTAFLMAREMDTQGFLAKMDQEFDRIRAAE